MTIVRRSSPFSELVSLRQAMDRLFEDSFVRPSRLLNSFDGGLPLDVRTTPDSIEIDASLPGVKPEDVEITVEGGTVTISATSTSDERDEDSDYLVHEIRRGSVSRTIALPSGYEPDKASAEFEHGLLRLSIPKAEQLKPRQIRITPKSGDADGNATTNGTQTTTPRVEAGTQA
ncbi:MAG TPA: Hsp20/alpha crystallin family protein [Candidatus Limnocylindrales bacterium]|nr:Hsp20/alpha crystallin family protein [Candidatus Limnocylindrales bacterium]